MTPEFTVQIMANDFDFISFNRSLELFFAENNLPQTKLFTIELIIEELITNTQKYGGNEKINIRIHLTANTATHKMTLTISDNASPFDTSQCEKIDTSLSIDKREIGGLGLFLVQEKSETMKYEYKNHFNITTLTV